MIWYSSLTLAGMSGMQEQPIEHEFSEPSMTDVIEIKDLLLRAIIGVNDDERVHRQNVVVQLALYVQTQKAGISDDIADTVDYSILTKRVVELVEQSEFFLIEKLAAEISAICLEHPLVERVRVTVQKPRALRFARTVGLTIERSRDD